MSKGPHRMKAEPATYEDAPLASAIEAQMAQLHNAEQALQLVRLHLGRVSRDMRIRYEPNRGHKKSA